MTALRPLLLLATLSTLAACADAPTAPKARGAGAITTATRVVAPGTVVRLRWGGGADLAAGTRITVISAEPYVGEVQCGTTYVTSFLGRLSGSGGTIALNADGELKRGQRLEITGPAPREDGVDGSMCNTGTLFYATVL